MKIAPLSEAERAFLHGGGVADFAVGLGRHMHVRLRQALPQGAVLKVVWMDVGEGVSGQNEWLALDAILVAAWGAVRWKMALTPGAGGFAARVEEDLRVRLGRAYAQALLDGEGGMRSLQYQVQLDGAVGTCRFQPAAFGAPPALARWAQAMLERP